MSQRDRIRVDVEEHAAKQTEQVEQTEHAEHDAPQHHMLNIQQSMGNRAVQRLVSQVQRVPYEHGGELDDDLSNEINSKRGSGTSLDSGVAQGMGQTMGYDFSSVNVHSDSNADRISRSIGARAFTTGSDIFFKSGEYDPGSSAGQSLLAHELTHVVQQDGQAPSGKLSVGPANDSFEAEASGVADSVQMMRDDVQREELDEEDAVQMMRDDVQREELDEEDAVQMMRDVQREELDDEELMQG